MLMKLAEIIEKYQYPVKSQFKVQKQEDGSFVYTSTSEQDRLRSYRLMFSKNAGEIKHEGSQQYCGGVLFTGKEAL